MVKGLHQNVKADGYGCRGNMSGIHNKRHSYPLTILYTCKYINYIRHHLLEHNPITSIISDIYWNTVLSQVHHYIRHHLLEHIPFSSTSIISDICWNTMTFTFKGGLGSIQNKINQTYQSQCNKWRPQVCFNLIKSLETLWLKNQCSNEWARE